MGTGCARRLRRPADSANDYGGFKKERWPRLGLCANEFRHARTRMEPSLLATRDEKVWIEEFVDCIESSTLAKPRLDEAVAMKDACLPKKIYKYRRDGEYARANLETDTVWMASPDAYNDPYDCSFTEHIADLYSRGRLCRLN